MRLPSLRHGRPFFSLIMVVATITVIGIVAFRFLDAQDNTQVAETTTTSVPAPAETQVATVETVEDVETVTSELEQAEAELDTIDAELETEFAF